MFKKFLLTFIVGAMALFAATQVIAVDVAPVGQISIGECTMKIVLDANGQFPVQYIDPGTGERWWKFEYELSGCDVNKFSQMYLAIQYLHQDPIEVSETLVPGAQYWAPCEGGVNVSFGVGICTVRVARIDNQGNKLYIYADTNRVGGVSAYYKAGNKEYYGNNPIIGPGYDFPPIVRAGTPGYECKPLEEFNAEVNGPLAVGLERDPYTLCASMVYEHHTLDCSDQGILIVEETEGNLPFRAFSGAANQFCEEAFSQYVQSPSCFVYTSGGRTRYIPSGCK